MFAPATLRFAGPAVDWAAVNPAPAAEGDDDVFDRRAPGPGTSWWLAALVAVAALCAALVAYEAIRFHEARARVRAAQAA